MPILLYRYLKWRHVGLYNRYTTTRTYKMKLGLSVAMAALCLLRIYPLINEIGLFALFNVFYALVWLVSAVMLRFEFRRYLR